MIAANVMVSFGQLGHGINGNPAGKGMITDVLQLIMIVMLLAVLAVGLWPLFLNPDRRQPFGCAAVRCRGPGHHRHGAVRTA